MTESEINKLEAVLWSTNREETSNAWDKFRRDHYLSNDTDRMFPVHCEFRPNEEQEE